MHAGGFFGALSAMAAALGGRVCDVGFVQLVIRKELPLAVRDRGGTNVSSPAARLHHVRRACAIRGS